MATGAGGAERHGAAVSGSHGGPRGPCASHRSGGALWGVPSGVCIDGSGTIARRNRWRCSTSPMTSRSSPLRLDPEWRPPSARCGGAIGAGAPGPWSYWLGQDGIDPVPARSTIYRVLVRNHLIVPVPRKRKRDSYVRWERDASMALWQHDFIRGCASSPAVSQGGDRDRRPLALLRVGQGGDPGQRAPGLPRLRPGAREPMGSPTRCSATTACSSPIG